MPQFTIQDPTGRNLTVEGDAPPNPEQIKQIFDANPAPVPEPKMSVIQSAATGAASAAVPTVGAWAGAKAAASLTAKFAAKRIASGAVGVGIGELAGGGPVDPVADVLGIGLGLVGVIGGSSALDWVQNKILPDRIKNLISKAHEDHPIASDVGSVAASLGAFEMQSPKKLAGGAYDLLRGKMTREAKGVAMGAGLGAAVSVGQPLVTGQPITGENVAMGIIQSMIAGNTRFSEKHGANTPAAAKDAAAKIVAQMTPEEIAHAEQTKKDGVAPEIKQAMDETGVPYVLHNDTDQVVAKETEKAKTEAVETAAAKPADDINDLLEGKVPADTKKEEVVTEKAPVPEVKIPTNWDLEAQLKQLKFTESQKKKIRTMSADEQRKAIEVRKAAMDVDDAASKTAADAPKTDAAPAPKAEETPVATPKENTKPLEDFTAQVKSVKTMEELNALYPKLMADTGMTPEHKNQAESEMVDKQNELIQQELESGDVDRQEASTRTKDKEETGTGHMWFDRRDGKIHVSAARLSQVVNAMRYHGHSERAIRKQVQNLIAHEQIHSATPDDAAISLWDAMTAPEKWAVKKIYSGSEGRSDLYMAHEAFRMRMQEILGMKPDELTEMAGTERLKLDVIYGMQKAVRLIRENLVSRGIKGRASATIRSVQIRLNHAEQAANEKVQGASSRLADFSNPYEKLALEHEDSAEEYSQLGDVEGHDAMVAQARQLRAWGDQKNLEGTQNARSRLINIKKLKSTAQDPDAEAYVAYLRQQQQEHPEAFMDKSTQVGDAVSEVEATQRMVNGRVEDMMSKAIEDLEAGRRTASLTHSVRELEKHYEGRLQKGVLHEMLGQAFWKRIEGLKGAEVDSLLNSELAKDVRKAGGKNEAKGLISLEKGITYRGTDDAPPAELTKEQAMEVFKLLSPDEKKAELAKQSEKPDKVLERQDGETIAASMRKRLKRQADLYMQMMEPILDETNFKREVTPEDVRLGGGKNEDSIVTLRTSDQKSIHKLKSSLLDFANRSKHDPRTASRRIAVLKSMSSDRVFMASVYSKDGQPMILDPITKGEHMGLPAILKRYQIIHSILLDEPVLGYSKTFAKYGDFSEQFLQPALARESRANKYQQQTISDSEAMQAMTARYTKGSTPIGSRIVDEFGNEADKHDPLAEEKIKEMRKMGAEERRKQLDEIDAELEKGSDINESDRIRLEREIEAFEKDPQLSQEAEGFGSNVERGGGGHVSGPAAAETHAMIGTGRSGIRTKEPLKDYEAGKLYDAIKWTDSPEVVARIIKQLKEFKDPVLTNALGKYARKVFVEYRKVARKYNAKQQQLMGELLINQTARLLVGIRAKSASRADFVRRILKATNPKPTERWSSLEHLDTKKELEMPLDRRAPTDVQGAPQGTGAPMPEASAQPSIEPALDHRDLRWMDALIAFTSDARPSEYQDVRDPFSGKERAKISQETKQSLAKAREDYLSGKRADAPQAALSDPTTGISGDIQERLDWLADKSRKLPITTKQIQDLQKMSLEERNRKQFAATRLWVEDGINDVKRVTGAYLSRREAKDIQSRYLDAAGNLAANGARDAGWTVKNCFNMASNMFGVLKDKSVEKKLAGVNPLVAAKAIARKFVWSDSAKARAVEIANSQREYRLVRAMMDGDITKTKVILAQLEAEPNLPKSQGKKVWDSKKQEMVEEHPGKADLGDTNRKYIQGLKDKLNNGLIKTDQLAALGSEYGKILRAGVERQLINEGQLKFKDAEYSFDPSQLKRLDVFKQQVADGIEKAKKLLAGPDRLQHLKARAWLESNAKLMEELDYAKTHWRDAEMQTASIAATRAYDSAFEIGKQNGYQAKFDYGYLPDRYNAEFFNNDTVDFGEKRILGRQWTKGKTFENYYEAASVDAYIPTTRDSSALVEHSTRQVLNKVNEKQWQEGWYAMKDSVTGAPLAAPMKSVNGYEVADLPPEYSGNQYVNLKGVDGKNVAVLHGYDRLYRQLTEPSAITSWLPSRGALMLSQFMKHTMLVGDFFHASRIMFYSRAVMGLNAGAHKPGWACLEFSEHNLAKAVESGAVSKEAAAWCLEKVPTNFDGQKSFMTRSALAKEMQKRGLNVGQIQDAIYKDLVHHWPLIGGVLDKYNKFLFDKLTRGLMTRSAISEFERISKLDPELDSHRIAMTVSRDINNLFGSIGRQGWVKSRTFQDIFRMAFLAPQWAEGLIKKDAAIPYKLLTGVRNGEAMRMLKGQETLGRGIGRGLLAMAVLTQVLNMITKGKPTWDNEDKDHKFDADIGSGLFLSPLAVYNEILHDLVRYNETKPKAWDALQTIGENKFSPYSRAALVLATDKSPTGEYQTTSAGVLGTAAKQLIPIPITGRGSFRAMLAIAQGKEPNPMQMRGAMAIAGLKAEIGRSVMARVRSSAEDFVKENHLKTETSVITTTDEPNYQKLRHALEIGDVSGAEGLLTELRKDKGDHAIIDAMKLWEKKPFTGSLKNERKWLGSMTDNERAQYDAALVARRQLYNKWHEFFIAHRQQ
jgi:hypothetical protein